MISRVKRRAARSLRRFCNQISQEQTRRALGDALGEGADVLFVHSSLSSLGYFSGGPENVLKVFREFSGTLTLPTHTYCYPSVRGGQGPVFDPVSTPSQNGLLTETFRKQAGVVRSISPTHSMASSGPLALELVAGHELLDAPCGQGSPYSRLIKKRASVLLFGVSFHSYTPYHTAEDAAESPFAYEEGTIDCLRYLNCDGEVRERLSRRQSWTPRRFNEAGDLLERAGLVRRVPLGAGYLLLVPDCAKVHDFLVQRLRKVPDFLYQNCAELLA